MLAISTRRIAVEIDREDTQYKALHHWLQPLRNSILSYEENAMKTTLMMLGDPRSTPYLLVVFLCAELNPLPVSSSCFSS